MRFDRRRRLTGSTWSKRKETAFLQRHKRVAKRIERDVPLFADQFAPQPETDVEAEKARRNRCAIEGEQSMRDLDAKHWRKGRSAYFACVPELRARIIEEWNNWRGPLRATYFIYIVEKHNGEAERRRRYHDEQRRELIKRILPDPNSQHVLPF
ncbi:hypothetical protein [Burkholderia cepacia]|uniref:hypothetical protein n=1 Tax=Burkholderia cepacia TaxID=292 RepID=UPI0006687EC4|nr:hypothetical protein [Burkholderia cepacia]